VKVLTLNSFILNFIFVKEIEKNVKLNGTDILTNLKNELNKRIENKKK